jgi:hypothetical protein
MYSKNSPLKITIIGNHSNYHCGSAAAFQVILKECERHGKVVASDSNYDVLVVNGEGSMHHDSKNCQQKLTAIESAVKAEKKVYLINTVWQSNSLVNLNILKCCKQIVVREIFSQKELNNLGLNSTVLIDQSYFFPIDNLTNFINFKGRSVFTDFYSREFMTFCRPTTQWTRSVHYIQMHEWSWSQLVKSLRTANLLMTGRHHAVYAACCARIPFLALRGNTHKIEGLIASSGVNIPIFTTYLELLEAYRKKLWLHYDYDALFDWMETQKPWTLKV